jgi:hypothetical protein
MALAQNIEVPTNKTAERRISRRQRVLKRALIVFNNGQCAIGCQILDISDIGAKLMPADVFLCPKEFILKPQIGDPLYCEVILRKSTTIGVRYLR